MDLNISEAAGAAEKAVEAVMRVEPMIAAGVGMLVPGAAPVVATVQPIIVMAAPFIERALNAISAQNGGDAFSALLDLLNHISPGRPNSMVLAQNVQSFTPAPDASKAGSG
jgi:hypothetical protein